MGGWTHQVGLAFQPAASRHTGGRVTAVSPGPDSSDAVCGAAYPPSLAVSLLPLQDERNLNELWACARLDTRFRGCVVGGCSDLVEIPSAGGIATRTIVAPYGGTAPAVRLSSCRHLGRPNEGRWGNPLPLLRHAFPYGVHNDFRPFSTFHIHGPLPSLYAAVPHVQSELGIGLTALRRLITGAP